MSPSPSKNSNDIDAAFSAVQNLETMYESEGRAAGSSQGANQGHEEGLETGWVTGFSITSELEYYVGASAALISLSESFPERVGNATLSAAEKLYKHLQSHPLYKEGNNAELDMDIHLENARAMFKRMTASARMHRLKWNTDTIGGELGRVQAAMREFNF